MDPERHLEICGEPDTWFITLKPDGHLLVLHAHGYHQENGAFVFSLLMEGKPRFEIEVLRISAEIVADVVGG